MGEVLLQSSAVSRYYKVGQELLESGAGNLLQSETTLLQCGTDIAKCGKHYYKIVQLPVTTNWERARTKWGR